MEQDKKKLIDDANFIQKNIDWWIEETSLACDEVDEIDSNPDLSEKEIEKRFNRLEYLVGKADVEIQQIDDLEERSIKHFKKLYEEKNRPPHARLVKRKKRKLS